MPDKLPHLCQWPRCPNYAVARGYCAEHYHADNQRRYREDPRASHSKRGYNRRHEKWARMVIGRDIVCQHCGVRLASEADHIVPPKWGGSWTALENGQALCASCHSKKTRMENKEQ